MASGSPLPCSHSACDLLYGKVLLKKAKDKSVYSRKITGSFGSSQETRGQQSPSLSVSSVKWSDSLYQGWEKRKTGSPSGSAGQGEETSWWEKLGSRWFFLVCCLLKYMQSSLMELIDHPIRSLSTAVKSCAKGRWVLQAGAGNQASSWQNTA